MQKEKQQPYSKERLWSSPEIVDVKVKINNNTDILNHVFNNFAEVHVDVLWCVHTGQDEVWYQDREVNAFHEIV